MVALPKSSLWSTTWQERNCYCSHHHKPSLSLFLGHSCVLAHKVWGREEGHGCRQIFALLIRTFSPRTRARPHSLLSLHPLHSRKLWCLDSRAGLPWSSEQVRAKSSLINNVTIGERRGKESNVCLLVATRPQNFLEEGKSFFVPASRHTSNEFWLLTKKKTRFSPIFPSVPSWWRRAS